MPELRLSHRPHPYPFPVKFALPSLRVWLLPWVAALGLVAAAGCERTLAPPISGELYYPLRDSAERVYRVEDTTYTVSGAVVNRYRKREYTLGTVTDLTGRPLSRLEIYRAPLDVGPFTFRELWTQFRSSERAERTEGNTRYVVMNFPLRRGKTWDVNLFNNNAVGSDDDRLWARAVVGNMDTTVVLNGTRYTRCIFIRHRKDKSDSRDIYTYEIYAPGIGKIERYDRYMVYDIVPRPGGGVNFVLNTNSYIYREQLLSHTYPLTP